MNEKENYESSNNWGVSDILAYLSMKRLSKVDNQYFSDTNKADLDPISERNVTVSNLNVSMYNATPHNSAFFQDSNNTFIDFLENVLHIPMIPALAAFAAVCLGVLIILLIICICIVERRRKRKSKKQYLKDLMEDYPDLADGDDGEELALFGKLEYSIEFKIKKNELRVGVTQATDLPCPQGVSLDPYIVISLDPISKTSKQKRQKTKTVSKSSNPVFNQTFTFKLTYQNLSSKTLVFDIFDRDNVGQDLLFAQLKIPLGDLDSQLFLNKVYETSGALKEGEKLQVGKGDACIILKSLPDAHKIIVNILEFKSLQIDPLKMKRSHEVFVEITFSVGTKIIEKKTSRNRNEIKNPYFEEIFTFKVNAEKLPHASLLVKLFYPGLLPGMRICVGEAKLSAAVKDTPGYAHWKEMIANPKRPIAMWHVLWPEGAE